MAETAAQTPGKAAFPGHTETSSFLSFVSSACAFRGATELPTLPGGPERNTWPGSPGPDCDPGSAAAKEPTGPGGNGGQPARTAEP